MSDFHALVVEDDPSWQGILSEMLADLGLQVDVADTLEAALGQLSMVSYRVAVVDLSLSAADHRNKDGLQVLEAVRRHNPSCKALLLTGYATVELAVSALTEHGAFTCLRKETFNRGQFRDTMRQALAAAPLADDSDGDGVPADEELAGEHETDGTDAIALVVEDAAGWRDILSELLTEAGYRTRLCSGFGEALGYLGRERYDLAVVDLSLSGPLPVRPAGLGDRAHDGYRVLAFTRAHGLPTVVVSGVATADEIEHVYAEYGIFAAIAKQTFDRREFLAVVADARRAASPYEAFAQLTDRENQVLELLIQGLPNKDIAEALYISPNTVKRHLKAVFTKLGVNTRAAAVAKAVAANFTTHRA